MIQPGTREWLQWRRQGVGGSDAAVISGHDPFKTELELWLDKRGFMPLRENDETDEPTYWGKRLEPAVIERFQEQTGLFIVGRQQCIELTREEGQSWRRATVDGFVREAPDGYDAGERSLGIYEGKTSSRRAWAWSDGVPLHVQIQCQHNMDVADVEHCWIGALLTTPVIHFEIFELERDEAAIKVLRRLETRFWQRVLDDEPPPAGSSDVDALRAAFAKTVQGATIELGVDARELALTIRSEKQLAKVHEDLAMQAEAVLMEQMREHELATSDGQLVATWKQFERSYTDLDSLRAAHPKLAAKFTSKRGSRRFQVVAKSDEENE